MGDTSGVALVEAYDIDDGSADSKLGNISTRRLVGADTNVMIGGFILAGGDGVYSEVIVRGLGPFLGNFNLTGLLADPVLELHDSNGMMIATNDNWMEDMNMQTVIDQHLAPTDPKESAIYRVLQLGAYTAVLRGGGAPPASG